MATFSTPLRGQQELTLLGSEKTTSSLVVFIMQTFSCRIKYGKVKKRKLIWEIGYEMQNMWI